MIDRTYVRERQILYGYHLHVESNKVELLETKSRRWLPGAGEWGNQGEVKGYKPPVRRCIKFWRSNAQQLITQFNHTVLYSSKLLRDYLLNFSRQKRNHNYGVMSSVS